MTYYSSQTGATVGLYSRRSRYRRKPSCLARCAHVCCTLLKVFPFVSSLMASKKTPALHTCALPSSTTSISKQWPRMAHSRILIVFTPNLQGPPLKGYHVAAALGTWMWQFRIKAVWTNSFECVVPTRWDHRRRCTGRYQSVQLPAVHRCRQIGCKDSRPRTWCIWAPHKRPSTLPSTSLSASTFWLFF